MRNTLERGFDKIVAYIGLITVCSMCALWVTGCAGVELGGRLGVYRVDERADSSATVQAQTKPWKCYFTNCDMEKGS